MPEAVHIESFPKSGRTWLELMVARALARTSGRCVRDFLSGTVHEGIARDAGVPLVLFGHGHEKRRIRTGGAFPAAHYGARDVCVLLRDPRDVVVSRWYYERFHHGRFDGGLWEFVSWDWRSADPESRAGSWGLGPILNWTRAWLEHAHVPRRCMFVRYEDLRAGTGLELARVLGFAGLSVHEELLRDAVAYASMEHMRELERSNELDWYGLPGGARASARKTRSGGSGGWRSELSVEQGAWMSAEVERALGAGYAEATGDLVQRGAAQRVAG